MSIVTFCFEWWTWLIRMGHLHLWHMDILQDNLPLCVWCLMPWIGSSFCMVIHWSVLCFLQEHEVCLESETYREFSAILQYLQCVSNGDTAVLHQTIDIDGTSLCGNGCSVLIKVWSWIPVYLRDTNVSAMTNFNLGEKCLQTIQVISKSFTSLSLSIYIHTYINSSWKQGRIKDSSYHLINGREVGCVFCIRCSTELHKNKDNSTTCHHTL